jgi:glycosyltransferase involved in cell wall biosynthesis
MITPVSPSDRLRLCVVGDMDGIHTRSWLRYFVERGHEVHAVSYYAPSRPLEVEAVHALNPTRPLGSRAAAGASAQGVTPPSLLRLANAVRYWRRGLGRVVREIRPDVLHAHYVVEHGFYAALAGYHPYVVTAWGSDVLVAAASSPLARAIARFALRRADLVTSNNSHMARRIVELGVAEERVAVVTLGAERYFLEDPEATVNLRPSEAHPPTVISTRSLDSAQYQVDVILRAVARVRSALADVRLVVAGEGRLRPRLEALASELGLGSAVEFVGFLDREAFRNALARAHVFVSVPQSDATSVALLQAMAVGCFPIVSDLPTQEELVEDGANGFRVPVGGEVTLAERILAALSDADLRRQAVPLNRALVEEKGLSENNMARMEEWYYRLAGRPAPHAASS